MLRVLVDPDDPRPITVEKNPISSDFHSHLFFLGHRGACFQVQSSGPQGSIAEHPVTHCGGGEMLHHIETDERLSRDLIGMTSQYATMQELSREENLCRRPSYYSTFELGNETAPSYEFQGQQATLAHDTNTSPEMQTIKIEDCSQYDANAIHPEPPRTSFINDGVSAGDPTSQIVHPAVNISTFMATSASTLASLAESTSAAMLSCSAPITTSEECMSESSMSSLQTEWTSMTGNVLSESPRPPNERSALIADNDFTSATTSFPWLGFQLQQAADAPSQETNHDHFTWDTPRLSNETQLYEDISGALRQLAAVSNSPVDLSQFGNDNLDIPQPLLFSSSTRFNPPSVLSSSDGCAANPGYDELFPVANYHQCYRGPCRLDDPWELQSPNGISTLFQGQLSERPVAYPRETKNAFLIDCKLRGLSYKDIKRIGGFKEAESTLRGRFRTLTKSKDQRVRKPQWQEKDIRLLCEAVAVCAEPRRQANGHYTFCRPRSTNRLPKISWKKVAQYIWAHGGSYHFGNATCKKKWCEVTGMNI
ncbi:uncharacterized protein BO80DRAFT_349832 [Aspergillus ibericus CBS 121593]|uniref:Myb-like domain-containing protein n=1 Tax=Aspergillus ibericus CBS 121593 TaxID=1448316 RepID=A0A395H7H9_9EURO|nr:hypothetical protein BO80DRAFT_349832 [Aspergillus ibericus CBS 121593]RAL03610.1 hypothetical protein BO80DRAFT_349832 [Aspergillus ibericus CBS 121593]